MKTVINIKADQEIKQHAQKIAEELGLSLSAIINAYLKQFIRNREVNFSIIPKMSKGLEALLAEVEKEIKIKKNLSPKFSASADAIRYLNSL